MLQQIKSIRPFIGAKDFLLSRAFYIAMGFHEKVLFPNLSLFTKETIAFYLQDAYIKEWVDNSMIFVEVVDIDQYWKELEMLDLTGKFKTCRLLPIRNEAWGRECFLHDPSGILWHFGSFNQ